MLWPLWKTVWRFLRKLKIVLTCDPAVPLLGIYLDRTMIQKDTCTFLFIGDVVHVYNGILLSHKKERNNNIGSNMSGPRDDYAK